MKNRYIKLISIICIVFLTLFYFNKVIEISADSGWDTSYDSVGGSSSGSSFDSSSNWDSRDSGSSENHRELTPEEERDLETKSIILTFILFAFSVILILLLLLPKSRKLAKEIEEIKKKRHEELNNKIDSIMPRLNKKDIEELAYQIFYDVQMAWMEFDYDKLKPLLSDGLYNVYVMDLEILKQKNQKNIMKKFRLVKAELIDLNLQNNIYSVQVELEVKFIDYIEDCKSNKVLRGKKRHSVDNTYILTFEKTKEEKADNICPKCGAFVEGNATGICEHCGAKLINNTYDWILTKKEIIRQK